MTATVSASSSYASLSLCDHIVNNTVIKRIRRGQKKTVRRLFSVAVVRWTVQRASVRRKCVVVYGFLLLTLVSQSRTRVASLANKSREELERMVQSLLRMLKQRDKELKESEAKAAAISEGSTSKEANAFESERQTWAKEKSDLQAAHQKALSEKDQARQHAHVHLSYLYHTISLCSMT